MPLVTKRWSDLIYGPRGDSSINHARTASTSGGAGAQTATKLSPSTGCADSAGFTAPLLSPRIRRAKDVTC
jgi:hypothetical protein